MLSFISLLMPFSFWVQDSKDDTGIMVLAPRLHCNQLVLQALAGSNEEGFVNGAAADARFNTVIAACLDGEGNLIIADSGNNAIRFFNSAKGISGLESSLTLRFW